MYYKYGYYRVGDEIHYSSMLAHLAASKNKKPIYWVYHEDIFSQIKKENLGKLPLDFFYKQRALQLRDKYDYLILNYSGGSDSHNILMTFLNNNIHLDQITVRFPFSVLNSDAHKPNNINTRQANRHSEWNYTVKPTLDWVGSKFPKTKIVLLDWLNETAFNNLKDDAFIEPRGGWFLGSLLRSSNFTYDPVEREMIDKGKTVALIWGVDKPRLACLSTDSGEKVYMSLRDKPMTLFSPTLHNPNGNEHFYWTPDMPELAWEMAYKTFQFFNANKHLRYIIKTTTGKNSHLAANFKWQKFCDLTCTLLYSTWDDNRFQVEKPTWGTSFDMRPGDIMIETLPEIQNIKNKWRYLWKSYDKMLDRSVPSIMENGEFTNVPTKWHHIGTFV